MQLGMVGLGRMGANMTLRLVRGGHRVVGFDPNPEARERIEAQGAGASASTVRLRRRITAAPPLRSTRASVTTSLFFAESFSRSSAICASSSVAIALRSSMPRAFAFSTNSPRSMPSSSAIL